MSVTSKPARSSIPSLADGVVELVVLHDALGIPKARLELWRWHPEYPRKQSEFMSGGAVFCRSYIVKEFFDNRDGGSSMASWRRGAASGRG